MNIGEASAASGVSAKMIRYYEGRGLIKSIERTASGYRVYTKSDVHILQFIRRARDLGFSVPQIESLLALWHNRERASSDVKAIALEHVEHLCVKVAEMEAMIGTLRHLAEHCSDDARPDCPILEDLADGRRGDCASPPESRFGTTRVQ
ncbi:MAG: Cu(I)-responsive transcriptional regulator [Pseudomonadota bacterium]|nr:Cu(I)-responsive transcriptional regulator [Pseudomonadota bacterium]